MFDYANVEAMIMRINPQIEGKCSVLNRWEKKFRKMSVKV